MKTKTSKFLKMRPKAERGLSLWLSLLLVIML